MQGACCAALCIKCRVADAAGDILDACGQTDMCQLFGVVKGVAFDMRHAVGDVNRFEPGAIVEGIGPNPRDALLDFQLGETAAREAVFPD